MDPSLIERGPPIAEDDISRFESRLGTVLPADYRRFLAATNGGRPPQNYIQHPDGNTGLIQQFSSLGVAHLPNLKTYDLERNLSHGVPLPAGLVEIANDDFGNLYCLAPSNGAVYFWDREEEGFQDDPDFPTMGPASLIAASFDEFLAALVEDTEPL